MNDYLDDTRGLRLDPELLVQVGYTGMREVYIPLKLEQGRILLAIGGAERPTQSQLDRLVRLYQKVELLEVPPANYQRALWAYYGNHRPAPPQPAEPPAAGITFPVAAVEPAEEPLTQTTLWQYCREEFTEVLGVSDFYTKVLEKQRVSPSELIAAAYLAFSQHRPLVLSPDILWVTFLQGLTDHFDKNANRLRPKMVQHQGQLRLNIERPDFVLESLENPWEEVFEGFRHSIRAHLNPQVADFAEIKFSTTGAVEQAAFSIALMDMLKVYFQYSMNCICGIPEIRLEGTPEDYRRLRQAVGKWRELELGWWIDKLDPILRQFERAADGEVDSSFWNDLYQRHDPFEGGYGGPLERLTGWITQLFPYYGEKPNTDPQQEYFAAGFRSSQSRASVLLNGQRKLEFVGGLLAVEQRGLALRPRIGWVVHEQTEGFIEDDCQREISRLRPELRGQFRGV